MKKDIEAINKSQEEMKNTISEWKNTVEGMKSRLGEEEQGIKNLFEKVMMKNFLNLMREKVTQIQETQRVPSKRNPKRPTLRHILIKTAKFQDKERILKAAREKQDITYKGAPIRLADDFSMETLQARREWQEIFQVMKSKGLQP